jgi:predicted porin
MKKTIIASAIAAVVAAPAAIAEVKISGNVNMELLDQDAASGWDNSTNTDLVISGSEDLGNGMKAGFKYHLFHDDGASTTITTSSATAVFATTTANASLTTETFVTSASVSNKVADLTVFLSGDFGKINAGRQENFNMAYFHGFAAGDAAHDITLEDVNGQQSRMNSVEYTSPNMNGLTIGLEAGIDAGMANSGTDTDNMDMTDVMVKYSNGPLTVAAGKTTHKGGTAADEEVTNIAASYKMGDLKLAVLDRDVDNSDAGTANNEMTTFSATYSMGANTLYVGVTDSDDAQDGDYVVSLKHSLSKRTSVYVVAKNDDSDNNTDTLVGIKHSF